ncbi:hypothetical protein MTR_5g019195 [Medicago truncatula]|uniref:Uncharacterized protein n=1 Tax=Medicago truncatula TaxID=3880 RepID=A0A072UCN0_MEDTR|nr:hypothetical protein MTR_5g019195 [Medicago truncatula]
MHDDLVQSCQKSLKTNFQQEDSRGKWTPNYEGSRAITSPTMDDKLALPMNAGSKDKVTASGQAQSTWGIQLSKDLRLEASADQRLGTGAFKVVRENNGYCVQCTLPITFTIFPKFSKIRGAMPLTGHHSIHQT